MGVVAFNGSPRTEWNTATLLKKTLEGAASEGADTQLINLYDLTFTGCTSCFACKTRGGSSYGKCAVQDGLTPILKMVEEADAIVLGAPIYFMSETGVMRCFLERLLFPYFTYTDPPHSLFPRNMPTAFVYTMGIPESMLEGSGIAQRVSVNERLLRLVFGSTESLLSFDTYQFADYSKVVADRIDPVAKAKRRDEVFPLECQRALELGARLVKSGSTLG